MEPEKIMENLFNELGAALKAISKAKTIEEKLAYSKVIKNLSESLGVFMGFSDMMEDDDPED